MTHATEIRDILADDKRWTIALEQSAIDRRRAVRAAQLTDDELATAAARYGLVPDYRALPLNTCRPEAIDAIQTGCPGNDLGAYARAHEARARMRELNDIAASHRIGRAGLLVGEVHPYER